MLTNVLKKYRFSTLALGLIMMSALSWAAYEDTKQTLPWYVSLPTMWLGMALGWTIYSRVVTPLLIEMNWGLLLLSGFLLSYQEIPMDSRVREIYVKALRDLSEKT